MVEVGYDAEVRATGEQGRVSMTNGNAHKVCGKWYLTEELYIPGTVVQEWRKKLATGRENNGDRYSLNLYRMPDEAKEDLECFVGAMKFLGLRKDFEGTYEEAAWEAVKAEPYNWQFVRGPLRFDREMLKLALSYPTHVDTIVKAFPNNLKSDRELCLLAVKAAPRSLKHCCDEFRRDKEFGIAAEYSLDCVLEPLNSDREFVLPALEKSAYNLKFAGETIKADRDLVQPLVMRNLRMLEHVSPELKDDRDFAMALTAPEVSDNGYGYFQYFSERLKGDPELAARAVKQHHYNMAFCPDSIKSNVEVAKIDPVRTWSYIDESLKNDRSLVEEAISKGLSLQQVGDQFKADRGLVLTAVRLNWYMLSYAPEAFKNDRDIVLLAVTQNQDALEYASDALKKDKEIQDVAKNAPKTMFDLPTALMYDGDCSGGNPAFYFFYDGQLLPNSIGANFQASQKDLAEKCGFQLNLYDVSRAKAANWRKGCGYYGVSGDSETPLLVCMQGGRSHVPVLTLEPSKLEDADAALASILAVFPKHSESLAAVLPPLLKH